MIACLTGRPVQVDSESVVVDVNGVGYLVRATTGVLQAAARTGDGELVVFVHTNVREDAIQLFGFSSTAERAVFERLLTLQGVGPKVALAIVSAYDPATIRRAAEHEDVALFQSVPGIGPKVARRIVTELRDKLADLAMGGITLVAQVGDGDGDGDAPGAHDGGSFYEAREALVGLGLSVQAAELALRQTEEGASADERVRQALQGARA